MQALTQDVVKSSEIEGETLDVQTVRSSIARRMGWILERCVPLTAISRALLTMLDATKKFDKPLTQERLFNWHGALFPTGRSGLQRITVGAWRPKESGAMQVVFGLIGREKVHFEARSHDRLKVEMSAFIKWFNSENEADLVLKSALAHFWFVTIHPFEDGNGRIARAIADLLLVSSENTPQRFTACRRKSSRSIMVITMCWKKAKRVRSILRFGSSGI